MIAASLTESSRVEPVDTQIKQAMSAGKPDGLDFRKARVLQGWETGVPFVDAVAQAVLTPIQGALGVRIRFKATCDGALAFEYRRNSPDIVTAYTGAPAPSADVPVTADTEAVANIAPGGEAYLVVTFTPSADGAVTYADIMQQ